MPFEYHQKVLFKHCDPAGIVFYPRYIEMINDCTEAYFNRVLQWPWESMLRTSGTPTVNTTTDFKAPSRHGDELIFTLKIENLGRTSMTFTVDAHCAEELRFANKTTLVCVNLEGSPVPWPDFIRVNSQSG